MYQHFAFRGIPSKRGISEGLQRTINRFRNAHVGIKPRTAQVISKNVNNVSAHPAAYNLVTA